MIVPAAAPERGRVNAQLYIWDDRFLWASWSFQGAMTHRYATNVIAAIDATRPLSLRLPGRTARPCGAAVCAAGAKRCVGATDVPFLSLNLDPGTAAAQALERLVPDRAVQPVERPALARCDGAMADLLAGRLDDGAARALGDDIVQALTGQPPRTAAVDERVRAVAEILRESLPADLQVEQLARAVALSPPRLTHLFSEQMGLSMSSFLLWQKMRRALSLAQHRRSLTEVAHACGFADSSHLTRTFQAFYAVKPSVLLDSRYVQVRLCESG